MLLRDILISNAHRLPNKLALVDGNHRLSWKELNDKVNRVSNALIGIGLSKGDRIAVIGENCHQYVELLFASTKIGVMAAVILKEGHDVTEDELKEHCRRHLARYQVPKRIVFVKEFPRHPLWKRVLKKELVQQLEGKWE